MSVINVLYIEDNLADFTLVRELLEEAYPSKYSLVSATDLSEALSSLLKDHFEIILLDYRLGNEDGLDIAKSLIKANIAAPIILITAFPSDALDQEAERIGIYDFIKKDDVTASLLDKSMRYVLSRKANADKEKQSVLIDPETGLFNKTLFYRDAEIIFNRVKFTKANASFIGIQIRKYSYLEIKKGRSNLTPAIISLSKQISSISLPYGIAYRVNDSRFFIILYDYPLETELEKVLQGIENIETPDDIKLTVAYYCKGNIQTWQGVYDYINSELKVK